ncbi:fimbrial biogenesis chaperone [Shewanella ulleungensis]|uniref:Sigma-fimbriae chaperone protein n=1 Tax=Shewanella ulleungensis TaxID=2282699 RepID=A0ABQ2QEN9_9GAMM|nr:fimbria/pilus periplasmic chaperone [Shewanella ulleungensis]MCL1148748.1 fimbria/pilus periplasmic chaperone [Shewanella ulleungensis]GGP75867.1 sigma-fimbriae chaperone protein [Shewanella ulleungensis]
MKHLAPLLLASVLAINPVSLSAAELLISPVNIDIAPGEKAALLKLQNNSNTAMKIQVRVRQWDAHNSKQDKPKVVVSPSSLNILPGKQQVVRIVNTGPASDINNERLYRVFLDEIPDMQNTSDQGLLLQVRYALPLFIGGPNLSVARTENFDQLTSIWNRALTYSYNKNANQLSFTNQANGHARISKVRYTNGSDKESVVFGGLLGYVQANSQAAFAVSPVALTSSSKLFAEINGVDVEINHDGR